MSKATKYNLTRDQYELISDLIPEAKRGGRKREVDMWEILYISLLYISLCGKINPDC
ncbi:hypothetical protein [Aetokthonos hydrillicola]|jgi:hypothetical protein|uniref:hypothetical protein n=1 Tax=Aetokthonos hydrillicola TaxID=1550245 RepID=UPI001ABB4621|nr:hypothetical protein [Aetokthonos hydrillicola CCALA 1050]